MAYAPIDPHEQMHASVTDAVHHMVRLHPDPARKVNYGKILSILLGDQARQHATNAQGQGGYGGGVAEATQGPAQQMVALPPPVGALGIGVHAAPPVGVTPEGLGPQAPSLLDVLRAHIAQRAAATPYYG